MTFVRYDYCSVEPVNGPDHAGELFDHDTTRFLMHGGSGITLWFGPAGEPEISQIPEKLAALRIDADSQEGRAAIRWLPDGSYAVEFDPVDPIVVWESHDTGAVTIPAELARVSIDTARRAVAEYIRTGQRPTGVDWVAG